MSNKQITKYNVCIQFNQLVADAFNSGDMYQLGIVVYGIISENKERDEKYKAEYKESIRAEILADAVK